MALTYPVVDGTQWRRIEKAPVLRTLKARLYHARWTLTMKSEPAADLRRHSGSFTPLATDDLPLVCVVRDAGNYIRAFLRYYRGLGVTRFLIVDDNSVDGTRSVLENADDVDLYTSPQVFRQAHRHWRDALFAKYGRNRWYVSVDSDEFLIYPGSEQRPLPAFIADLEHAGHDRCHAAMLDIYPPGPLKDGVFVDDGRTWPFEVSTHFDGDGYAITPERYGFAVRGGPTSRVFGRRMRLSKFPLLWVDEATDYRRGSIHGPGPSYRNFTPPTAVLLHYRFSSRSLDEFRSIVEVGGHADGSVHYRAMLADMKDDTEYSLVYEGSRRYGGSRDLVDKGFIMPLDAQAENRNRTR